MRKVLECGERNGTTGTLFPAVSRTEPSVNPPALTISEGKVPCKFKFVEVAESFIR